MQTFKKNRKNKHYTRKNMKFTFGKLDKICKKYDKINKQIEITNNMVGKVSSINIESELVKLINKNPNKSINPKNDFYSYVNYHWLEENKKKLKNTPKYYAEYDSFRVVQEKVYYELIDIAKNYIKTHNNHKSSSLKSLYNSMHNLNEKSAMKSINFGLNVIDKYIKNNDFYGLIGRINKNEILSWGCPIVWNVLRDQKNVKYYRSNISSPMLTAYDYEIYIDDVSDSPKTKQYKYNFKLKFFTFLEEMFSLCLGKNHNINPNDIWNCEIDILTAMGCNSVKNDDEDGVNYLNKKDALEKYNFDWDKLSQAIGYKNTPNLFICSSTNYLKCIMETLLVDDAWKTPKWRSYFLYIIFRQMIRFHPKGKEIHYNFFGKFVNGLQSPYPKDIYPVFALSFCYNKLLVNEYIEKNYDAEKIAYITTMGNDLITVFKRILQRNKWLSNKTKNFALFKLSKIKFIFGTPKILREDPILDYSSTDAYMNMYKLSHWRTKQFIKLDSKSSDIDIPMINWNNFSMTGKQSYIVNAFYTPTENSIYIPLAYLQKPFIDIEKQGIEYNLAHIGYTLAHEMSHSLDDMGSRFDEKGNLHNWWTKRDRHLFNLKVKDVIKQYETFSKNDGIEFDASLSVGEDLADISGLAICIEYLRDLQHYRNDAYAIRIISFHTFFIYIAIQARQFIFHNAIKAQLKTNPHPMEKYRTNCVLARLKIFNELFDINKNDKMYWHNKDTIW